MCTNAGAVCGTVLDNCDVTRTCDPCPLDHTCAGDQLSCDPDFYHCEYVDDADWNQEKCTEFLDTVNIDSLAAAQTACNALTGGDLDGDLTPGEANEDLVAGPGGCDTYLDSQLVLYAGYRHGNDVENPAYQKKVKRFVNSILKQELAQTSRAE